METERKLLLAQKVVFTPRVFDEATNLFQYPGKILMRWSGFFHNKHRKHSLAFFLFTRVTLYLFLIDYVFLRLRSKVLRWQRKLSFSWMSIESCYTETVLLYGNTHHISLSLSEREYSRFVSFATGGRRESVSCYHRVCLSGKQASGHVVRVQIGISPDRALLQSLLFVAAAVLLREKGILFHAIVLGHRTTSLYESSTMNEWMAETKKCLGNRFYGQ